jgi:cold shock CspA family protein
MLEANSDKYLLGEVKWFGGYNQRKGKENDFGFISSQVGNDIFVHKDELKNCGELNECDVVVFETGKRRGKQFAKSVYRVGCTGSAMLTALRIYIRAMEDELDQTDWADSGVIDSTGTFRSFESKLESCLRDEDEQFINLLQQEAVRNPHVYTISRRLLPGDHPIWTRIFPRISAGQSITDLLRSGVVVSTMPSEFVNEHEKKFVEYLTELDEPTRTAFLVQNILWLLYNTPKDGELNRFLKQEAAKRSDVFCAIRKPNSSFRHLWEDAFKDNVLNRSVGEYIQFGVPVSYLPDRYMREHSEELFNYIDALDWEKRKCLINDNINYLPGWVVLACELKKPAIENDPSGRGGRSFDRLLPLLFGYEDRSTIPAPDFAKEVFRSRLSEHKTGSSDSGLWQTIEQFLFKKRLFEKRTDIKDWLEASRFMKNKIEFFILANLFSLIQANNDLETAYKVFLHRLWKSLIADEVSLDDNGVFSLFPACRTMQYKHKCSLSCEAFYWDQRAIFLCRGKECTDPQVLPNPEKHHLGYSTKKHYLDFTIYDWFHHFGINYSIESKPSRRDFPVKLAGYINRLKEIFRVLHCRECEKLMQPDMRYARVEYQEYRDGELVTVNTSAAYRVTVFECGNPECGEYENKYYINHCIGFGCNRIIDSRDAKLKCDAGLYICTRCGSCCSEHGETKPVGLCPECGSALCLFENLGDKNRHGRYARYVECSNPDCKFELVGELPKKFYMEWCTPVKRVNHEPKVATYRPSNAKSRHRKPGKFGDEDQSSADDNPF